MAGNILSQQAASGTVAITLASLASSATKVVGRESTAIATDSDDFLDYLVGGIITVGATASANTSIDIWLYGALADGPTYSPNITGADAASTMASENQRNSGMKLFQSIVVDSSAYRPYGFGPTGVSALFGGEMPTDFGVWVAHNSTATLSVTAASHIVLYTGVYGRYT